MIGCTDTCCWYGLPHQSPSRSFPSRQAVLGKIRARDWWAELGLAVTVSEALDNIDAESDSWARLARS